VRRTLALQDDDIRFEGSDPNWPFKPPAGSVLLEHGQADPGEFEWDSLHDNDDLDIVLIRVPASLKAKHLEGTEIRFSEDGGASGEVEHKKQAYAISAVQSSSTDADVHNDLRGLKVMLPRRTAGGQLFLTTKEVGASLTLVGVPPKPAQSEDALRNPERPRYPLQMLSHTYVPFGAKQVPVPGTTGMDVDVPEPGARKSKSKKASSPTKDGEVKEKSKKRKKEATQDETGVPKKSKRAKQAA